MKNNVDKQYLELLKYILKNGELKEDRTGTGTISIFDYSMTFDMSEGFPLITSKKVFTKAVIHELIWFLRGDTNIKYLVDNGVNIWNGDAFKNYMKHSNEFKGVRLDTMEDFIERIKSDDEFAGKWGELGPVYGKQWRRFAGYEKIPTSWNHGAPTHYHNEPKGDQIKKLIEDLKNNPDSRRLMVNAWNVSELDQMVLPPCHFGFQCYTSLMSLEERVKRYQELNNVNYEPTHEELDELNFPKRKLSLKWFQRSADVPLGIPFNIASYAFLLHLLAREVNMIPSELIFSGGDCHIYLNQVDGIKKQLHNETYKLPKLEMSNTSIFDVKYDDFKIIDYKSSGTVNLPLSN